MDFGGGFATGIAVGIGSGMAMGASNGRQQAKNEMRKYIEQNNITIQDRFGKPVKVDDLMDAVCDNAAACNSCSRNWLVLTVVLGIALAAGVLAFFLA